MKKKKDSERFEEVVAQMQSTLSPKAKVTHNAFLPDKVTKELRQIDVLIEDSIGQIPIKIAVECKYHSRPISTGKVEEFITKLHDIGVQRGVMVSKMGFAKPALQKLKSAEIIPYVLYDSNNPDLSSSIYANVVWHNKVITPLGYKIGVFNGTDKDVKISFNDTSTPLYDSSKNKKGTLFEITQKSFNKGLLKDKCIGAYKEEKITEEKIYLLIDDNLIEIGPFISFECKIEHYWGRFKLNQIQAFYNVANQKIHTNNPIETTPILFDSKSPHWNKLTNKKVHLKAPVFEVDLLMFNSPKPPVISFKIDPFVLKKGNSQGL